MASITGYTAARMKSIEDATIIDAAIVGGNLILTKFDGTQINVGPVGGSGGGGPDPTAVHVTGNEAIGGIKTFSVAPVVPDAVSAQNPVAFHQLPANFPPISAAPTGNQILFASDSTHLQYKASGLTLQIIDKSADYTAVSGDHVIADMYGAPWRLLLPNAPSEGSIIGVNIKRAGYDLTVSTVGGVVPIGGNTSFVISLAGTVLRMVYHAGAWYHLILPPTMTLSKLMAFHKLNSATFDMAVVTANTPMVAQTVYMGYVEATKTEIINNLYTAFSTGGVGLPPSGTFAGLYSSTGTLLASSVDLSATIGTGSGIKGCPLGVSAPLVIAGVGYYVAFVTGIWGTTMPQLLRGAISAIANNNCPANLPRFGLDGTTGRLVLPASINMALTGQAPGIWFGMGV